MTDSARRLLAAALFGVIYAAGAAAAYARGPRVFVFHWAFAALSAWSFFTVSGLLGIRPPPPSLAHPLIRWPALVLLLSLAAAACLKLGGFDHPLHLMALPLLAAIALLAGSAGGWLSHWLRR